MGSFDMTCAISGLPIGAGDPIRYMLLTQNPYHRGKTAGESTCYQTDIWFPRTFPLRAKYNDYGGCDGLQAGPQADAWLFGLKKDLIEKGWGDNACHDVPAKKGMGMAALREAAWEGRLHVSQSVGRRGAEGKASPVPKGVPTRRRVERLLVKLGHKVCADYNDGGFLVNRVDANAVRVRAGGYQGRTDALVMLRDALAPHYAGMVSADTGSYAAEAALYLAPLPGVRSRSKPEKREPGLCVAAAMIREDVWQAICALPQPRHYGATSLDECRRLVKEAWDKSIALPDDFGRFMMRHDALGLPGDTIPFTVGLGTHWWALVDAREARGLSDAERDDFLATASELAFIMSWLGTTRYQWRPSAPCGPQCGEWASHAALLGAFRDLAAAEAGREAAERAKWDAEEAGQTEAA